jgi:site-specific recombinase XerD
MTKKIVARDIAALQPNSILWDAKVSGFCARRQFSEVVTYSVIFRNREGRQNWFKLGRHPILTPDIARKEAIRVLRAVTLGGDPSAERKVLRSAPTVSELCDEYQKRDNGKKAATIRSDNSRIKLHIKPKLGRLKVTAVTSGDVEAFMHSLSIGNQARAVGLLGAMFSYAMKRQLIAVNPCVGVDKPKDVRRTRRLSDAEYAQLHRAIGVANPTFASVVTLLAVSGFRSGEARYLKWSEVDLPRQSAILEDTKTGQSIRPLSKIAVEIIEAQPKNGIYVFGKPISNIRHQWRNLGMAKDISPHVLRHSFASLAADLGHSDNTIASLLGHSRASITSRYMHGSDKALIAAADSVGLETLRLMRS